MECLKHVLHYIKGTLQLSLLYSKDKNCAETITGYVDSDWASDRVDRKSTSGYLFKADMTNISARLQL